MITSTLKIREPPNVAPLISPRASGEHQRLLERKSMNSLDFDGIGARLEGIVIGFHFLSLVTRN